MLRDAYIGCDLGTTNVGLAVVDRASLRTEYLEFSNKADPFETHKLLRQFLADCKLPKEPAVFIESVFYWKNAATYQRLVRISHSLHLLFKGRYGADVQLLDNNTWKKVLTGSGKTKKDVAQEQIQALYPFLKEFPVAPRGHMSDALCVALTGLIQDGGYEDADYRRHLPGG
jgi:Holliday junction resolvasome RuvABC endonuclease subunit